MPRKRKSPGSGGPRQGTPGQNYPNRGPQMTQPVQAASGQSYGSRGTQEEAQKAIPLPAPAPPPGPTAQGPVTAGPLTPLNAPTQRPNEPLTQGLPMGAGAGPEIIGNQPVLDQNAELIRALYAEFPSDELADLILEMEVKGK